MQQECAEGVCACSAEPRDALHLTLPDESPLPSMTKSPKGPEGGQVQRRTGVGPFSASAPCAGPQAFLLMLRVAAQAQLGCTREERTAGLDHEKRRTQDSALPGLQTYMVCAKQVALFSLPGSRPKALPANERERESRDGTCVQQICSETRCKAGQAVSD